MQIIKIHFTHTWVCSWYEGFLPGFSLIIVTFFYNVQNIKILQLLYVLSDTTAMILCSLWDDL